MQPLYQAASVTEKFEMSVELVDFVHQRGGRFLKKDPKKSNQWKEVDFKYARSKASRALRGDSRRN